MTTSLRLDHRVVLITGAAGDLGHAIVTHCQAAGARVAALDQAGAALGKRYANRSDVLLVECDISDREQSRAAVEQVVAHFGALNALVNNAAVATRRNRVADIPLDDWDLAISVNLTGSFLMSRWAIPHLIAAGGGVILNIASQLGHVTARAGAAYSASKAAVHSLTRTLAVDYAADNIRAVSLSPGAIMTSRLTDRYGDEAAVNAALAPLHPAGRLGRPEEIAETAVFLLSDGASFITGSDVLADGGYTAV
ncbi:MAG: SDR family NAD(P)-dependent oxidoreductase [Betaproteobacteria bacterium]